MEIDLIATHKDNNEIVYVECKAKEKVSSDELSKFAFNVSHRKATRGLFIRTKELEHHAGGLLDEMINDVDNRYKNLTFFEPKKVIELLQESKFIKKHNLSQTHIFSKEILAVTYFGDFYVLIKKDSLGTLPTQVIIIDASTGESATDDNKIELLKKNIPEILNLTVLKIDSEHSLKPKTTTTAQVEIESISEVQETQNWYDYLPASSEHFVGRENVRSEIFNFFQNVLEAKTKRRLFYLTGKSGWGKSSLVAELRSRSRNKFYKNKFYTVAIDSRSALSSNFVALSFEKLLKRAIKMTLFLKIYFLKIYLLPLAMTYYLLIQLN